MSFTPSSSESPTSITSPPNAVRQQRKRKEITDPTISDPAERKRVLNVLAQRRYSEMIGVLLRGLLLTHSQDSESASNKHSLKTSSLRYSQTTQPRANALSTSLSGRTQETFQHHPWTSVFPQLGNPPAISCG